MELPSVDDDSEVELPWWSRTYASYAERFVQQYALEVAPNTQLFFDQAPCISAEHAQEAKASADGLCTASTVWDAGIVLAMHAFIAYQSNLPCTDSMHPCDQSNRLRCLDLGSGTGIVGIAAAASGAFGEVTLTDLPSVVPLLERNIAVNAAALKACSATVVARALLWDDISQLRQISGRLHLAARSISSWAGI